VTEPLVPARLAFAPDGTPFSERYQDLYHSAAGGEAQARHVFLRGNGLPERWRRRRLFTIAETGFGLGLSFLVAWQAWREDPARCARLHFVSVEKHPFSAHDLAVLHAPHPELAPLAAELQAAWPMLVPGMHRLEFEQGALVLTLALGDAARMLAQWQLAADAFFLDGFAPARNPEMWSREVMRQLSRLAAPEATAATWSVAAQVREGLRGAGFAAEKRRGFAAKSEMLVAELAPCRARASAPSLRAPAQRRALVVGAGVAGAAACERLAARGWDVILVERHGGPAAEASGNHAGTFHPVVSADDSVFARLTRAAFLYWLGRWRALDAIGAAPEWARCGVLQLARDALEEAVQRAALERHRYPADYAQYLTRAQAARCAGMKVAAGGIWFPEAGWMRPPSLVRSLLARCGDRLEARYGAEVVALERAGGAWSARDRRGAALAEAPVAILANSAGALRLAPQESVRLRRVRGQLSAIPGERLAQLRTVVLRGGFVLPPVDGVALAGATYDPEDEDPAPRESSHAGNLERLERILPGAAAGLDPARLEGRVAFRAVARDRLPVIGALADEAAAPRRGEPRLAGLPRLEGLYGAFAFGSRGLLWAGLGGELLASALEGEPLPLERALADALDPARFLLRAMRTR
jgi:tRNA 5-methylaminomethyl-2-thiouridine biosynthesis bifunctional protein